MQIHLSPEFQGTREGQEAESIVRNCVHCGFCTATCPTYQLLGDELDGPRGRIYLMKQVLEGAPVTSATQQHLDRCLTCRNCETTCPSGVQYGRLVEIGRDVVDARVPRPWPQRAVRWLLREGLTSRAFAPALRLGQWVRPLLPATLRRKVPARTATSRPLPMPSHTRKVLLLAGCVQPAMAPGIHGATVRVLDAAGIESIVAPGAGCCGALRSHLGDTPGGLDDMRRNIDAWWPWVDQVESIVMNASGCGATVKEYGHALAHDPAYADKARRIAGLTRDLSELLPDLAPRLKPRLGPLRRKHLVFHPPCTLQHGQKLRGGVETHLRALGFDVSLATEESHLCCGSAGAYSVLHPGIALNLRDRKLGHLLGRQPQAIVSANVGCITHLQSGTDVPVMHWVEAVDEALSRVSPV